MPEDKKPVGGQEVPQQAGEVVPVEAGPEFVAKEQANTHRQIEGALADFTELLTADSANRTEVAQGQAAAETAHTEVDRVAAEPATIGPAMVGEREESETGAPTLSPELTLELLKSLGIDLLLQSVIWKNLKPEDQRALRNLVAAGDNSKIIDFYRTKQAEIQKERAVQREALVERIKALRVGDVIVSKSGTRRKVLNIGPEVVTFERTAPGKAPEQEDMNIASQLLYDNSWIDKIEDVQIKGMATESPEPAKAEKRYAKLEHDPRYVELLERQCLLYLMTKDPNKDIFLSKYSGQCNDDGFLLDKEGKSTQVLPSQCIGEEGLAEAGRLAKQEFINLYIEKDLGYLDIDPKAIWEKLTPEDIKVLQDLMQNGDTAKLEEFYKTKIKDVLTEQQKDAANNEQLLQESAASINAIIQETVEFEAQRALLKSGAKGKGAMVAKLAVNAAIMAGASFMIGTLGIATGGIGVVGAAGAMAGVRLLSRKINERQERKNAVQRQKDYEDDLAKEKSEALKNLFSQNNIEKLRCQLSGHIANVLREQTSEQALQALRGYKQAGGEGEAEVLDARLRDVEKELYLNALTKVKAEYPESSIEQQKNMALTMALTLGQHERTENDARQRLEAIRQSKPALYKVIEKYNLLSAGRPDRKPAGMTSQEESVWRKSKYELMSLGIGTAVGVAVRTSGIGRIAMGAVVGAGIGYKVGEAIEKKAEQKALAEIAKMVDEGEAMIRDIELPSDQIADLKDNSIFVKSKLDLGLLDNDPLLYSRAENFVHQVQKLELANQESLQKLLSSLSERTDKRAKQVEDDLQIIGGKIKNRRLWTTIGGAVVGGALAWAAGELTHKKPEQDNTHPVGQKEPPTAGAEQTVVPPAEQAPQIPMESEVQSGDSVWKLAKEQLEQRYGHDRWETFGEARQTHMIDEIKDQVAAHPEAYGLHHDIDELRVGEKVDFSPSFSKPDALAQLELHADQHSAAELQNIIHTNADLRAAADHGVHLTNENVDQVAAAVRQHGVDYLSQDGSVHDWAWHGQAVDRMPNGDFVVVDSGQHLQTPDLAETINQGSQKDSEVVAQETATQAAAAQETVAQTAQQPVEQFLASSDPQHYNHDVYLTAKGNGQLDQIFMKAAESKDQVVMERFIRDWAGDHEISQNQQDIFLATLRDNDRIDLTLAGRLEVKNLEVLQQNYEAFKHNLLDSYHDVKHMPAGEWHPVQAGNEYALVQKYHTSVWPIRRDHWLIDTDGNTEVDIVATDDAAMKSIFAKHSFLTHTDNSRPLASADSFNGASDSMTGQPEMDLDQLNRNIFALDKFLDSHLSQENRLSALAAEIPAGGKVNIGGIVLSGENDKILWHIGNRPPIEINAENIDRVSKAILIIQDKIANVPQKDWADEIKRALRDAKIEK
ncbi:MAG: hypothetical protein WC465_00280 [Patescibacteria group bacterium]